ncbi:MAG: AraC family transcriptional regulator [Opitutaceae bacterium]
MGFFAGIEWINGAHMPRCTAWVDKVFPDYYCLNYAHRGQLKWRTGQNRFIALRAPVAWWTFPGPHFQYGIQEGPSWDHYFICFRGPRADDYRREGLLPVASRRLWAPIYDPVRFVRTFQAVIGPPVEASSAAQRRVHNLEDLLLQLAEPVTLPPEFTRDRRLQGLVHDIRQKPGESWELTAEAQRLGYSTPHFHRLFRKNTGLPPHRFLLQTRMEEAARLLHSGNLPLKAIAAAVGCPDIYYFSRLFRRHFGMPPGRYRREAGLP